MDVGHRIKEARKIAGVTQRELAEKSGVATGTIQQYELGKRQPRLEQLRQIALALGTSVSELVEPGYWGSLSQEERDGAWDSDHVHIADPHTPPRQRISAALDKLNDAGMEKAADVVEVIAEVPHYQAPIPKPKQ